MSKVQQVFLFFFVFHATSFVIVHPKSERISFYILTAVHWLAVSKEEKLLFNDFSMFSRSHLRTQTKFPLFSH